MRRGNECPADCAATVATSDAARAGDVFGTAARDGDAAAACAAADADTADADEEHERVKQSYDDVPWSIPLQCPHVG